MFLDSVTTAQSRRAGSHPSTWSNDIAHIDSPHSAWRGAEVKTTLSDKAAGSVSFISPPPSVADQDEMSISASAEGPLSANTSATESGSSSEEEKSMLHRARGVRRSGSISADDWTPPRSAWQKDRADRRRLNEILAPLDEFVELEPLTDPSANNEVEKPLRNEIDVGVSDSRSLLVASHKRPALYRRHAQKTGSSAVSLPRSRTTSNDYFEVIGDRELMSGALPDIDAATFQSSKSFSQTGSVRPISPPVTSIPTTSFRFRLPSRKSIKDSLISGFTSARESFRQRWSKPRSWHAGLKSDWRSARYSIKPRSRSRSRFTGYISDKVSHVTEFWKNRTRKRQYSIVPYDENELEVMPDPISPVERTLSQEWRDAGGAKFDQGTGVGRRYPTLSTDGR